jgi:phosphatidylinositol glycan class A protein
MCNESILMARALGLHAVYTDHSLFGFADAGSIHINKVLSLTLSDVDAVVCVSNTCRENLVLRTVIPPELCHVIPNAIDPSSFVPPTLAQRRAETARCVAH